MSVRECTRDGINPRLMNECMVDWSIDSN